MKKTITYLLFIIVLISNKNTSMAQTSILSDSIAPPIKSKIRHYEKSVDIKGNASEVFSFMDDINNTGMHMTKSNAQMMGGKLNLEWLTNNKTGLGTKYKWTGKVMGMKIMFTVLVTEWKDSKSKTWGTSGKAKMIVISWFKMDLNLIQNDNGTSTIKLGIDYTKSKNLLGFLLGKTYSKWCVKSMLNDTKKNFENHEKRN